MPRTVRFTMALLALLAAAKRRAALRAADARVPFEPAAGSASITGPTFAGRSDPAVTPSDATGAIGPTRYIQLVNEQYAIYDRTGHMVSLGTLGALTGLDQRCLTDPQIPWDATGGRFYYLVLDACRDRFAFGFSKTDSPSDTTAWCKYAGFSYGSSLPDFPKMG